MVSAGIRRTGCRRVLTEARHERDLALAAAMHKLVIVVVVVLLILDVARRRLRDARAPDRARRDLELAALAPRRLLKGARVSEPARLFAEDCV